MKAKAKARAYSGPKQIRPRLGQAPISGTFWEPTTSLECVSARMYFSGTLFDDFCVRRLFPGPSRTSISLQMGVKIRNFASYALAMGLGAFRVRFGHPFLCSFESSRMFFQYESVLKSPIAAFMRFWNDLCLFSQVSCISTPPPKGREVKQIYTQTFFKQEQKWFKQQSKAIENHKKCKNREFGKK